jgi:hypothetical protein
LIDSAGFAAVVLPEVGAVFGAEPNYPSTRGAQANPDSGAESWPFCHGANDASNRGSTQGSNPCTRFSYAQLTTSAPRQN